MTRIAGYGLLCLAVLFTSACSTLSVRVDVADPDEVRRMVDAGDQERRLHAYLHQSDADLGVRENVLRSRYRNALNALAAGFEAEAENQNASEAVRTWAANQAQAVQGIARSARVGDPTISNYIADARTLNAALRQAEARATGEERYWQAGPLGAALQARIDREHALERDLEDDLAVVLATLTANQLAGAPMEDGGSARDQIAAIIADNGLTPDRLARSIIGDGSLVDTPYAWEVANLPESAWRLSFNEARGRTYFGDSDLVIRLNSQGDFSIKGMSFNPASTAAMVDKAATQMLLTFVQAQGVPVTGSAGSQTGDALASTGQAVIDNEAQLLEREARQAAWRRSVLDMASVILGEEEAIGGASDERDQADAAIGAAYQAYEALLGLDDYD